MNEDSSFIRLPRWLLPVAIVWLLVAGVLLLQFWPDIPRTTRQWAFFFVLFPPLYVAGEAWNTWVFSPARGWAISRKKFSILRVVLALPVALVWFVLSWWFASLIGSAP